MSQANDDEVATASAGKTPNYPGPVRGVKYPLTLIYCGECGLPIDMCEYSANPDACKNWLNKNHPEISTKLQSLQIAETTSAPAATGESGEAAAAAAASADGDAEKKSNHQRRGGKGLPKAKKEKVPSKIIITKNQRKGNKYVTIITGLASNDIDMETAKKFFAQRFACACSKGEGDELIIQGDVVDSLCDVIPEKYSQISEDMIEVKEK